MVEQHIETPDADAPVLTIDELASVSGVPSRTIRFYQGKDILPPPQKRGRVAIYTRSHIERLQLISELQDRGLRLRAIRDVLSRPDTTAETIHEWLGVSERVGHFSTDAPVVMTEQELRDLLGGPKPGIISKLLKTDAIERQGEGRFLVQSSALLRVAVSLGQAGVDIDVAIGLREILEKRLARAADELVAYAIEHIGRGFGRSDDPKDVSTAIDALMPNAPGGDAVLAIFGREVSRSVSTRLQLGAEIISKRGKRSRR